MKKVNPSPKAQKFVRLYAQNLRADKPQKLGALARQAGYEKMGYVQKPDRLLKTKSVQKLFADAGISGERIAQEYNELLSMPTDKSEPISITNKIRMLKDLSNVVLSNPNDQKAPQFAFIERFLQVNNNQEKEGIREIIKESKELIDPKIEEGREIDKG